MTMTVADCKLHPGLTSAIRLQTLPPNGSRCVTTPSHNKPIVQGDGNLNLQRNSLDSTSHTIQIAFRCVRPHFVTNWPAMCLLLLAAIEQFSACNRRASRMKFSI